MSPKPITRFGYWKWVWIFSAPANFPAVYIREAIDVIDRLEITGDDQERGAAFEA